MALSNAEKQKAFRERRKPIIKLASSVHEVDRYLTETIESLHKIEARLLYLLRSVSDFKASLKIDSNGD